MKRQVEIISKLPSVFTRTLEEGQELCPKCGGVQLIAVGNYINQCPYCIGTKGVLDRCQYCGELKKYNHSCEGKRNAEKFQRQIKQREAWDKTNKITYEEAVQKYAMLFVDNYDEYVFAEDLPEWLENKEFDDEDFDRESLLIYGTTTEQIKLDSHSIIENVCDDLHEDAMDYIPDEAFKELDLFLADWVEKYGERTITYYQDRTVGVIVPEREGKPTLSTIYAFP